LSEEELRMIDENRHEVVYNPGETIFKQGTACTHVLSFTSGLAKIHMTGMNGKNLIIRLIKPIEFITGAGLFTNNMHHYSVTAIEKSCVCFIDKVIFFRLLEGNHKFCKEFMKLTQDHLIQSFEKLMNLNQKQNHGKVAESLLYLAGEIYGSNTFTLSITKTELSEMAGISKESTFKILKAFDSEGIINISGSSVEILNQELLSRISEKG
jgi:CRP/FNR family transcriptional regulator